MSVLDIERLSVRYKKPNGDEVIAVHDFTLSVAKGECVGIVGESGAGKSQAFLAAMSLLPSHAIVGGSVRFQEAEVLGAEAATLNRIRGSRLAMVFQDPLTSLTPHLTIEEQIAETLRAHAGLSTTQARQRVLELLTRVQISDPRRRLNQYPHELSGGMRQRVMIAMALACSPAMVIADEPTTALDVTIQAQIIRLLSDLKREHALALVLITHDLGIVAGIADRVVVMQAGLVVEQGDVQTLLTAPQHPHTRALLAATQRIDGDVAVRPVAAGAADSVVSASDLEVRYTTRGHGWRAASIRALDGVEFSASAGEAIGIVGESGSGKSTLARAVLRLLRPSQGRIVWLGREVTGSAASELRALRRNLQIVFQDPMASLDPRMTVEQIVTEPLIVHSHGASRASLRKAALEALQQVALPEEMLQRYPHQLSGGQAQRVGIARAMILRPRVLVCDEAVSSLDVTTQAQIMALIETLRREHGLTLLFISHNLAVVRQLCDRVLVLYLGRMMEMAPARELYAQPAHPYTKSLLDAIPIPDPRVQPGRLLEALQGELPSPSNPPAGCVFHTRCPYSIDRCRREKPEWESAGDGRQVACHRWREWRNGLD